MGSSKRIAEPSCDLEIDERCETFRLRGGGALAPCFRSILSVPGGRVDEREGGHARRIPPCKRLSDTASHRTAGDESTAPPDVIKQLHQVAREQIRCERHGVPARAAVSATVVSKNLCSARESGDDAIPDTRVECQGMNENHA